MEFIIVNCMIVYRIDLFTAYYEETMLHIQLLRFLKNVFGSLFLYYYLHTPLKKMSPIWQD